MREMTNAKCTHCDNEAKTSRIPPGWKRIGEDVLCKACMKHEYVLRAITIPVAGPVDGEWKELREVLRDMWGQTTSLSNWLVSHYYAADVKRVPGMEKLLPMPQVYLYPQAREAFPGIPPTSVVAIDHAVARKYRSKRYDVIWRASESLPNYRYPTPFPVHNQSWKATCLDDGRPAVSVRIGDRRWTIRLRGGHQFERQLAGFAGFVDGSSIRGELALYDQRSHKSDHRNGVDGKDANGRETHSRLMCKMVGYFPRKKAREASGTLFVRTDSESLLVALNEKDDRLWVENCDHVRRWTAEHRRKLQRWSDDQKAEQRPTANYQSRRDMAARKYRDRMDSLIHEVSAHLVGYARRRRFSVIRYDDTVKSYCGQFRWFALKEKIEYKCDEAGIAFEYSSASKNTEGARKSETVGDL
jgi:hypothetical protein